MQVLWGSKTAVLYADAVSQQDQQEQVKTNRDLFLPVLMLFSAMQQDQHCSYPQVFWTTRGAASNPDRAPPGLHPISIVSTRDLSLPLPGPQSKNRNKRDGTCLCFLVVFLLTFLALTGVGLAMLQIFHLQKDLDTLRKLSDTGHVPQSPEMLKGFLNGTAEKIVKRRAHLTGKANQKSLPLEWESIHGHAFVSGVQYKNRALVIDEAGLYFVYSKVFFRGRACVTQPLGHVVYKRNPAYPGIQVLMEERKMNYCTGAQVWGKSSYLGALFNLSRQDNVYVNVSEIALVNPEESKTFFGLYKL